MNTYFVYTRRPNTKGEQIEASYSEAEKPEAKALATLRKAQLIATGQPSRVVVQEATNA